jgi:hypothetical protein
MPQVMIRCPVTGEFTPTGIGMSARAFNDPDNAHAKDLENPQVVQCRYCQGSHSWTRKDAVLGDR